MKHPFHAVLALVLVPVLLITAGFLWFSADALRAPRQPPHCDGIVALTGGPNRIDTSLTLLREGYGQRLLISGVDRHATLAQVLSEARVSVPSVMTSRITLGRRAVTTIGNGIETAEWARSQGIRSVVVVTAGYHIRRAMMEIHRAAPELVLEPYPVRSPAPEHILTRHGAILMMREYGKWLGSLLGVTRRAPLAPGS